MNCPKCDKEYREDVPPFCVDCGAQLGVPRTPWIPPPTSQTAPKKTWRDKKVLLAAVVLGLVVLIALAVVLPLTLISTPGPKEVYGRFVAALARGDYATARSLLTAKDESHMTSTDIRTYCEKNSIDPQNLIVQKEEVSGTEAQLTILNKSTGTTLYMPCYKENGAWKVDLSESTDNSGGSNNSNGSY